MRPALLALVGLTAACSAVQVQFRARSYDSTAAGAVKRIVVAAWAPEAHAPLAQVIAQVAADRVKLTRSYLVYGADPVTRDWPEACGERDGVLMLRAIDVETTGDAARLAIVASLFDCRSGALVWRAFGRGGGVADDADLANLSRVYASRIGTTASRWAAPVFVLLQELLADLPEPALSDQEIEEKIELG